MRWVIPPAPKPSLVPSPENKWGFPKIRGTFLGVLILRIIVYWGLYWGSPYFGKLPNCHLFTHLYHGITLGMVFHEGGGGRLLLGKGDEFQAKLSMVNSERVRVINNPIRTCDFFPTGSYFP